MKILMIDNDSTFINAVEFSLKGYIEDLDIINTSNVKAGLTLLRNHNFDCVLLKYDLPFCYGLGYFNQTGRPNKTNAPVIVFIEDENEHLTQKLLLNGAKGVFKKSTLNGDILMRAILDAID